MDLQEQSRHSWHLPGDGQPSLVQIIDDLGSTEASNLPVTRLYRQ